MRRFELGYDTESDGWTRLAPDEESMAIGLTERVRSAG